MTLAFHVGNVEFESHWGHLRTKQGFTVSDGRVLIKINRQRNRIWLVRLVGYGTCLSHTNKVGSNPAPVAKAVLKQYLNESETLDHLLLTLAHSGWYP